MDSNLCNVFSVTLLRVLFIKYGFVHIAFEITFSPNLFKANFTLFSTLFPLVWHLFEIILGNFVET